MVTNGGGQRGSSPSNDPRLRLSTHNPSSVTADGTRGPALASIAEVRAWARKKGLTVGAGGHLTEALIRAYNRSHHRHAVSANPNRSKK